jgi:hypothetical protein
MLTDKQIIEYQQTYKKICDEELSKEEAQESFNNLVEFFELLIKIDQRIKAKNQLPKKLK